MKEIEQYNNDIFEKIKHIDNDGNEYWLARELQHVLEYKEWRKFNSVIEKAVNACKGSNYDASDHFVQLDKMIDIAKGAKRKIKDYKLSRYACYLIVQNADSHMKVIALGQTYFAIQTRRQELSDAEYQLLSEDEKRLYRRKQTKDGNKALYRIARKKGVKDLDRFTNSGYRGLYNGETANDIAKRKNLRYREEILDNMGSAELGINVFRITETELLLGMQEKQDEEKANKTHYKVGKVIREALKKLGSPMPEGLPTPKKSLKQIEKEQKQLYNEVNK